MSKQRRLQITPAQTLLRESNTAFDHRLWDRFEFIGLLEKSARLAEADYRQMNTYGYSFVQDAAYGLQGNVPNGSPIGKIWNRVLTSPGADDLVAQFRAGDDAAKVALVLGLGNEMIHRVYAKGTLSDKEAKQKAEQMFPPTPEQPEEELAQQEPEAMPEQPEEPETSDEQETDEELDGDEESTGMDDESVNESDGEQETDEDTEEELGLGDAGDEETDGEQEDESGAAMAAGIDANEEQESSDTAGPLVAWDVNRQSNALDADFEHMGELATAASAMWSFLSLDGSREEQLDQVTQLAEYVNAKFFLQMLGWATKIIKGEARKHQKHTGAMTGYKSGGWSERVVPHEMMEVARGNPIYAAKLSENALTTRVFDGDENLGKGPVIVLRDESSSMVDSGKPTRHERALSLELAMVKNFNKDRREVISVAWSSNGIRTHVYGEKEDGSHIRGFLSGGTRIELALEKALQLANEYVEGADILIITDGELQFDPSSLNRGRTALGKTLTEGIKAYREDNGRIWAVNVGSDQERFLTDMDFIDAFVGVKDIETGNKKLEDILVHIANRDSDKQGRRVL